MSRTAKAINAKISFGEYEEEAKENPFNEDVAKFLKHAETHPNASFIVNVDVDDEQSAKNKIQRAANDLGKTLRHRATDDSKVKVTGKDEDGDDIREGEVTLIFTATERHKARRTKKGAKPADESAE